MKKIKAYKGSLTQGNTTIWLQDSDSGLLTPKPGSFPLACATLLQLHHLQALVHDHQLQLSPKWLRQ